MTSSVIYSRDGSRSGRWASRPRGANVKGALEQMLHTRYDRFAVLVTFTRMFAVHVLPVLRFQDKERAYKL